MATSDDTPDNSTRRDPTWRYFKYAAVAVVAVLVVAGVLLYQAGFFLSSGGEWERRGQFGDMFGAVNALFSGLAFAGVIIAIVLQRNELALQRSELELNRQELSRSAEALGEQVQMLELSSRLSAITTLVAVHERQLDTMAESERKLDTALNQARVDLTDASVWLQQHARALEQARKGVMDEEERLQEVEAAQRRFDQQERLVRDYTEQVQDLETRLSTNNIERNAISEKYNRLVGELEKVVEESIDQATT